jgi:multicomponent Na+:H+ antiporter subunit E
MRLLGRVVPLVALWLLAWGEVTVANVASGVAVAAALLVAFPVNRGADQHLRLNPWGATRLAGYVVGQLVTSNVVMTREILRRHAKFSPGVLAHRLRAPSEEVVTIMTSVIALSPGSMTVDVDRGSTTIYVHFLFLRDIESARASLNRLERLASRAISAPDLPGQSVPSPKESP